MERLHQRGIRNTHLTSAIDPKISVNHDTISKASSGGDFTNSGGSFVPSEANKITKPTEMPKRTLTEEQKKRIEDNRKKALEIQERLQKNHRDASSSTTENIPVPQGLREAELAKRKYDQLQVDKGAIKKKDYIDFDFSTMKDSHGGFMNEEQGEEINQSLEDWKAKQKREHIVRELPPPLDISAAPKCFECNSLEIDPNLYSNFRQVRVCRRCAKEKPEKYALLTKTECREDYLLTEPELKDINLLPRIEKPNPHGYSRMQLFLRFQIEEFAIKKWGSLENLDKEWERREEMRLKRKDKKYIEQLKKMRRKTRAEEFTRKLRNGESINDKHVHDWQDMGEIENDGMKFNKKRCSECGMETEDLII